MADIKIPVGSGSGSDCGGDGDERGERGRRGHRGPVGPTGPTGPGSSSSGGLLKFSGLVAVDEGGGLLTSFLADAGVGPASPSPDVTFAPNYPVAIEHSLMNLAVNLLDGIVILSGSVVVELLQNSVAVPGFSVTYGPSGTGASGILTATAGPVPFAIGDTFDLQVTTSGLAALELAALSISATVGVV